MKAEVITISRLNVIDALKEKFYGNDAGSWSKHSNKKLGDWYKEYILNNKDAKIKVI